MDAKGQQPPSYPQTAEYAQQQQYPQQQQQQQQQHPNAYPMQSMPAQQPYPPQGYNAPQQQQQQQQQPPQGGLQPMPLQSLQTASMPVYCPQCRKVVNTVTTFEAGNFAHVAALALCCATWICCWIPYVFKGLQDVTHRCPTCSVIFAIFHRSGRTEVLIQQSQPTH